jgi:hypothetical protein
MYLFFICHFLQTVFRASEAAHPRMALRGLSWKPAFSERAMGALDFTGCRFADNGFVVCQGTGINEPGCGGKASLVIAN